MVWKALSFRVLLQHPSQPAPLVKRLPPRKVSYFINREIDTELSILVKPMGGRSKSKENLFTSLGHVASVFRENTQYVIT